jgi:polysaccharide export outer membrane protein
MKPLRFVFAALLVAMSANAVLGQENTASDPQTGDPQLKQNPIKALQNFEPAAGEEYALGPGDEISLDFPGRPELSGKKIVGPDGRITVSLIGAIKVADKNRQEVAKLLVDALSLYYKDLTVTINIDKYGSNRVTIIGSVAHPGVLYFDDTPTLLDVLARGGMMASSGGLAAGASTGSSARSGTGSSLKDGIPDRCAIYRGNDQVVWVDLRQLLQSGNSLADMRLRRNDIVFVPAQQEVFISVLGAVMHPGAVPLTPESTMASVLALSGGLAEGAKGSNIQVIQPSTGKTVSVSFKSLLTVKGTDEVKLHAGDVIYVPTSAFYKTTYVIQRISPIATMGLAAAVAP